jgi:hypothetical protein
VFGFMQIIFIQKVLYRNIYIIWAVSEYFSTNFHPNSIAGKLQFHSVLCIQNFHPKSTVSGHLNCYRWACSLTAAAAAAAVGGGGAAAASWALAGCSPLGPGFQIC